MNVRVKICGITNSEDAQASVEAGADALGFVFCETSPRQVTFEKAARIIAGLPPFIAKVAVFANAPEHAVRKALACGIDTLQFHGDETPEFCRRFRAPVLKAFRVRDRESLEPMLAYDHEAWLLDSYVADKLGGTGERFNWDLARVAVERTSRVILAGGLTPANVADAVRQVRPYAVDVSSGVEAAPGRKDHDKVREFVAQAKRAVRPFG
jgi:phosphoribosylanthranilate isomerase